MAGGTSEAAGFRARAWCRADLAGGTLDIWPLGLLHPGARTVNVALAVAVEVSIAPRAAGARVRQGEEVEDAASWEELVDRPGAALVALVALERGLGPAHLEIASASPRGAGLGASSALAVATIAAVDASRGRPAATPARASSLARDIEARLMSLPTGCQDHYPALLGGALEIRYAPGGDRVRPLATDLAALGDALTVAYTGASHFSAGKNWQIVRRRLDGDRDTRARFAAIAEVAEAMAGALEAGDLERCGRLMAVEWSHRRRLARSISTPAIEDLLAAALAAGAWGGKALGAGGGGSVAVLGPASRRTAIERALAEAGGRLLGARPATGPLAVMAL